MSSFTEESEKSESIAEIKTIKNKTFREVNEDMLIANYIADSSLQTVRDAIKRRDINKLTKANKLFAPVFKDLRVDGELVFLENRLVIPRDMRQAVLNSIHKRHPGRDTILEAVEEVWWPQTHRQIVASAEYCPQCQNARKY